MAGDDEEGGGGCCTTTSLTGVLIEPVAGVVGAGGLGLAAGGLGLAAGEPPLLEDEPPEQRPLVLGLGKTRPWLGEL